jgi:hypothetical protein
MTERTKSGVQDLNAEHRPRGAYGFQLTGVPAARELLVEAPSHWPRLDLEVCITSEPEPPGDHVDDEFAVLRLRSGGSARIERGAGCATFMLGQRPSDGALVHPHLASVAVVAAHWLGRETFHAGAFLAGGGVWGVLGDKEAGKSSLLASLALAGVPVVSDDILVLDQMMALAGPRSIDLRAGAARHLAVGEAVGVMGTRERWRLVLGPIAAEAPMRGWVLLRWDTDTGVRALSGSERLIRLAAHRGGRLYPPEPGLLVALSALPVLELRRPQSWESGRDAIERLLEAVG